MQVQHQATPYASWAGLRMGPGWEQPRACEKGPVECKKPKTGCASAALDVSMVVTSQHHGHIHPEVGDSLIALRELLSKTWEPSNLRAIVGGIAFSCRWGTPACTYDVCGRTDSEPGAAGGVWWDVECCASLPPFPPHLPVANYVLSSLGSAADPYKQVATRRMLGRNGAQRVHAVKNDAACPSCHPHCVPPPHAVNSSPIEVGGRGSDQLTIGSAMINYGLVVVNHVVLSPSQHSTQSSLHQLLHLYLMNNLDPNTMFIFLSTMAQEFAPGGPASQAASTAPAS
ncbi:hypothetical protein B0H14DRAFT_2572939 [Mycena olivaceomarginata]|nr:hypothetical protein B0H14DRAFT_2572939 [Mycena olivaceomarginata]